MNRKGIITILVFIILGIVSFYFDPIIVKEVSLIRNPLLDNFFLGITFLSSTIIIFFIITSFFLWEEKKRRWILPLWITLGISGFITLILKISVQRLRPFQVGLVSLLPVLNESGFTTWDFSFPSSHAVLVFCALPILSKEFPKLKYLWLVFAILISFSRLYFGVHYLSDIIAGGLIGYIVGIFILKYEEDNKLFYNIYRMIFRK